MREVRLYGELGRRFGRVHRFAVSNAAEALRALRANFPNFEREFLAVASHYRVIVGRRTLDAAEQTFDPSGERDAIRFIPVILGAGGRAGGILKIIAGVALIAAGAYPILGEGFFLLSGLSATIAVNVGTALVINGTAQLLTPTPKTSTQSTGEQKTSAVFSGPVNTTAQGNPVPVGYGRLVIGSAVISASLTSREFA